MTAMMKAPAAPSGFFRMNPVISSPQVTGGASGAVAVCTSGYWTAIGLPVADARVEPRVGEIDDEVHHHEPEGDEEHEGLHHGIVAMGDRVDHETPHAVQGEHRLRDHEAADEERELRADQGDDGQHGVAEGVADDHRALAETLGPRGADVVVAQDLEEGGPR